MISTGCILSVDIFEIVVFVCYCYQDIATTIHTCLKILVAEKFELQAIEINHKLDLNTAIVIRDLLGLKIVQDNWWADLRK